MIFTVLAIIGIIIFVLFFWVKNLSEEIQYWQRRHYSLEGDLKRLDEKVWKLGSKLNYKYDNDWQPKGEQK